MEGMLGVKNLAIGCTAGTEKAFPSFYEVILSADGGFETDFMF